MVVKQQHIMFKVGPIWTILIFKPPFQLIVLLESYYTPTIPTPTHIPTGLNIKSKHTLVPAIVVKGAIISQTIQNVTCGVFGVGLAIGVSFGIICGLGGFGCIHWSCSDHLWLDWVWLVVVSKVEKGVGGFCEVGRGVFWWWWRWWFFWKIFLIIFLALTRLFFSFTSSHSPTYSRPPLQLEIPFVQLPSMGTTVWTQIQPTISSTPKAHLNFIKSCRHRVWNDSIPTCRRGDCADLIKEWSILICISKVEIISANTFPITPVTLYKFRTPDSPRAFETTIYLRTELRWLNPGFSTQILIVSNNIQIEPLSTLYCHSLWNHHEEGWMGFLCKTHSPSFVQGLVWVIGGDGVNLKLSLLILLIKISIILPS